MLCCVVLDWVMLDWVGCTVLCWIGLCCTVLWCVGLGCVELCYVGLDWIYLVCDSVEQDPKFALMLRLRGKCCPFAGPCQATVVSQ